MGHLFFFFAVTILRFNDVLMPKQAQSLVLERQNFNCSVIPVCGKLLLDALVILLQACTKIFLTEGCWGKFNERHAVINQEQA